MLCKETIQFTLFIQKNCFLLLSNRSLNSKLECWYLSVVVFRNSQWTFVWMRFFHVFCVCSSIEKFQIAITNHTLFGEKIWVFVGIIRICGTSGINTIPWRIFIFIHHVPLFDVNFRFEMCDSDFELSTSFNIYICFYWLTENCESKTVILSIHAMCMKAKSE